MRCQNCSAENPQGAKFCIQCATPFSHRCQKCGFENPSEAKFCAQCAAPLDAAAPIRAESEVSDGLTGERRHLTVLFCDLVGSTEIASHLDPEEWRGIVGEYHRAATQAIERYGGHVAQYLGDGVMAYFGWPEAHDNDADRGARAGLAILEAVSKLNEQPARPELSARIGIDSGAVVVGTGAGGDADVFGATPNIAARVQAVAEPGAVVITDAVHRLVSGLFVVEDRGAQALKGIERPVQLYRVVQPSGIRGRLEAAAAARGLTPFVGREDELRLLMNRWERALEDEGQVALVIGEAGIGKSRLVQRFHEQIAGTPHTWVEAAAGAFFLNTPFYAITEMLRELLAWHGDESAEEQLAQLESAMELAGLKPAEALLLIAPLLNLPPPAKYTPSPLTRAAAPPIAGDAGRVGAWRCPSANDNNRDRRFALGRPLDAGATPTARRAGGDGAAAATVHGSAGVSRPMVAAGASYANHAQPTQFAQCAHDGGRSSGAKGIVGGDHCDCTRAHRRGATFCRGADTRGAREWQCKAHGA